MGDEASVSPICIVLAALSGISLTLAAVVVAYPEHVAKEKDYKRGACAKCASILFNLLFTCLGVVMQVLAVGYGSVAIVTPMASGANLLSNLVLQPLLGLAMFSQDAIIGTLVLVASVTMLIEVGPADVPADQDVMEMVMRPASIIFICSTFALMIFSILAISCSWVKTNLYLVLLYGAVGSSDMVINTALTKLVQMDIPLLVRIPLLFLYVVLAVVGIMNGAHANGELDDPSLFVPVSAGANLILTCIAGLMVWGDGGRLQQPITYAMVYICVILGTYLLCKEDILGLANHKVNEAHVGKLRRTQTHTNLAYVDTDLHPNAPRGKLARNMNLDGKVLKERMKGAVPQDAEGIDRMVDFIEQAILAYSPPGTWTSPTWHQFVQARLDKLPPAPPQDGGKYQPLKQEEP